MALAPDMSARVLVRHVDVREPEAAHGRPTWRRPRSDPGRPVWRRRDEGLVLDDQRDLTAGTVPAATVIDADRAPPLTSVLLDRVLQQVARGLAGVDVEAGDAVGVVVVEHQPGALLVGVVERQGAGARIVGRSGRPLRDRCPVSRRTTCRGRCAR